MNIVLHEHHSKLPSHIDGVVRKNTPQCAQQNNYQHSVSAYSWLGGEFGIHVCSLPTVCLFLFWAASLHRLCKMVLSSPLRRTLRTVSSSGQRFLPSLRTRVALPLGPPPACGSCRACVLPSVTSGAYSPGFGLRPPAKAPPPQTCLAHLSLQPPTRVSARHLAG